MYKKLIVALAAASTLLSAPAFAVDGWACAVVKSAPETRRCVSLPGFPGASFEFEIDYDAGSVDAVITGAGESFSDALAGLAGLPGVTVLSVIGKEVNFDLEGVGLGTMTVSQADPGKLILHAGVIKLTGTRK